MENELNRIRSAAEHMQNENQQRLTLMENEMQTRIHEMQRAQ